LELDPAAELLAGPAPDLICNLGQGGSLSSPEELKINLGSGNSGPGITIDATQGQNGSELVTINLNQQKNYDLIVNLFNSPSTTHAQDITGNTLSVSA
jgi:hypothetical protein